MVAARVRSCTPKSVNPAIESWMQDAGRYVIQAGPQGVFLVTKRADERLRLLEHPVVYRVSGAQQERCNCPAGNHPDCRHRKQVRFFQRYLCCPACGLSSTPYADFWPAFYPDASFPLFDVLELVCARCERAREAAGRGGWIRKSTRLDWLGRYLTREEANQIQAILDSDRPFSDPYREEDA